jgi:condensation domain-containing protein
MSSDWSALARRVEQLSPERRLLLERLLAKEPLSSPRPPVTQRSGRSGIFPLAFEQEPYWIQSHSESEPALNPVAGALSLRGPLSTSALKRSLDLVVNRHGALRTAFTVREGLPRQVVHPTAACPLQIDDVSGVNEADRETTVAQLIQSELRPPFDLAQEPLVRARLIRLAEHEHQLIVTMHHIISDIRSLDIFVREVLLYLERLGRDEDAPLPTLPVQYADYALWQREHLGAAALESQLGYWELQLRDLPILRFPGSERNTPDAEWCESVHSFTVPVELCERAHILARQERATLFMVLLGVFQVVLGKVLGTEHVLVAVPVSARKGPELADVIGVFVNIVLLRGDLTGDPTFRQVLRATRERSLGAFANQDLPVQRVLDQLSAPEGVGEQACCEVMFQFEQGSVLGRSVTHDFRPLRVSESRAPWGLALFLEEAQGSLFGHVAYDAGRLSSKTIPSLVSRFKDYLASVTREPDLPVSSLAS